MRSTLAVAFAFLLCAAVARGTDTDVVVLHPSDKALNAVRFFSDSNRIACGGDDDDLHIWDISNAKEIATLKGHTGAITDIDIPNFQSRVTTVSKDKTFRRWDLDNRRLLYSVTATQPLSHLAYSPDGNFCIVGGDANTDLMLENIPRKFLDGWPNKIVGGGGVAWSKDGKWVATAGLDDAINLFDGKIYNKVGSLQGSNIKSGCIAFSSDSKRLLSTHDDGSIRVWDIGSGKQTYQMIGHSAPVSAAEFSPDGKLIISAARNKTVFLWDAVTGKSLQNVETPANVNAVAFAPTGANVALATDQGDVFIVPVISSFGAPALASLNDPVRRTSDKPKSIAKTLTSIRGMTVLKTDTFAIGSTIEIILNVPADSRDAPDAGTAHLMRDVGKDMKISFDEAVRAVKVRYPKWSGGRLDVSFADKYTGLDGGSAGTAFATLMLSSLEGFDIDPKFAVTGDIAVNSKVLEIGGVPHKLAGALEAKCTSAAIPEANEPSFADMGLMEGHHAYWDLQVFSIGTLPQAAALARMDRDAKLSEAMKIFADLQPQLNKTESDTLKKPDTIAALKHILELAPNHLSAKYTLALATNTAPKTLSEAATMYSLYAILSPWHSIFRDDFKESDIAGVKVPPPLAFQTRKRLDILRTVGNKNLSSLITDVAAFAETASSVSSGTTQLSNYLARRKTIRADFPKLVSDPDYLMLRLLAGY